MKRNSKNKKKLVMIIKEEIRNESKALKEMERT
jgi:hypothetical protein